MHLCVSLQNTVNEVGAPNKRIQSSSLRSGNVSAMEIGNAE